MAVGVQGVMDLVFKASIVTAQQSPPSACPSDGLGVRCISSVPITCQLRFGGCEVLPGCCWQGGLRRSWALELASTICTLINLFNLTILYQPERIMMHKLLFKLEACLPLTEPHAAL